MLKIDQTAQLHGLKGSNLVMCTQLCEELASQPEEFRNTKLNLHLNKMHLPFCPSFSDCLMREVRKTYINILEKVALTLNELAKYPVDLSGLHVLRVLCVPCVVKSIVKNVNIPFTFLTRFVIKGKICFCKFFVLVACEP